MQMHRRMFFAVGADHFGERQRTVAHSRVQHAEVQRATQFALERSGVQFKAFQFTEQAQGFLMKELAFAGQTEAATAAMAQHDAQRRLQLTHVSADC